VKEFVSIASTPPPLIKGIGEDISEERLRLSSTLPQRIARLKGV